MYYTEKVLKWIFFSLCFASFMSVGELLDLHDSLHFSTLTIQLLLVGRFGDWGWCISPAFPQDILSKRVGVIFYLLKRPWGMLKDRLMHVITSIKSYMLRGFIPVWSDVRFLHKHLYLVKDICWITCRIMVIFICISKLFRRIKYCALNLSLGASISIWSS